MSWILTGKTRVNTRTRWLRCDRVVVEVEQSRPMGCGDSDPQPSTEGRIEYRWKEATPMDLVVIMGAPYKEMKR